MAVAGLYLYCIISCPEVREFGNIGVGAPPGRVFTVNYEDLALVASTALQKTYEPIRRNVMAHEKVITTVMQEFTVIPISFGHVCKDRGQGEQILTDNYKLWKENLEYLTGKLEVGLRVIWKKETFRDSVFTADPELKPLMRKLEAKQGSGTYLNTVEFGQLVEQAAEKSRRKFEQGIYFPLKELAVEAKLNKIIGERMVFNAVFLVDKDRETEFDAKVNDLYLAYQDVLDFKYTGPWPPHNFVDIRIKG